MTVRTTSLWLLLIWRFTASQGFVHPIASTTATASKEREASWKLNSLFDEWKEFQQTRNRLALVEALVQPKAELTPIYLVGQSNLPSASTIAQKRTIPCIVLSTTKPSKKKDKPLSFSGSSSSDCLFLPLSDPNQLKLLSFVVQDKPLSKSLLLTLNPLLVNRDGALFDNLPWPQWTVDPQQRNLDAAGNNILPKFHFGKRDAYQRFGGKDWKGRSVSIGNLAKRLKYSLQQAQPRPPEPSEATQLATRILQLQIKELQDQVTEWNYELAVAEQNNADAVPQLQESRLRCLDQLDQARDSLQKLKDPPSSAFSLTLNGICQILDRIADATTDFGQNAAPYRGAYGYAPMLDTEQDLEDGLLPFSSPFGLMQEILEDQLKAKVIGAILENASLLEGTLVVGGAVVLQRITAQKTVSLAGEEVRVSDEEEEYGNKGLKGGEILLVECDADEAIGMALTAQVALLAESDLVDRATIPAAPQETSGTAESVLDLLTYWKPVEGDVAFLVEGQATNQSAPLDPAKLRIPRTSISLFDSLFDAVTSEPSSLSSSSSSSSASSSWFPTDNPVQSLEQLDSLSNSDKGQTLLSMSNFEGRLPRPRAVRNAPADQNPLDEMLVPLIDESVRRQYRIREAERSGDWDLVRQLEGTKSKRQEALELAEAAREVGDEAEAAKWEAEAKVYGDMRADVTQDEGSYSRFLDRDEWYVREQQARIERLKKRRKKIFGTLFDDDSHSCA